MTAIAETMSSVLAEFKSNPRDAKEFATEMLVVQRRQAWLHAVLHGPASALDALVQPLLHPDQAASSASDAASASGSSSAVRAGPCAGFEGLKIIDAMEAHKFKFRSCTSVEQINEVSNSILPLKEALRRLERILQDSSERLPKC
jgi:hypothetical protein